MDNPFKESGWGKINFFQLENGYKFSIDTVLLAAFIKFKKNNNLLDLGSGESIIPLFLKQRESPFNYTGIEIQRELFELGNKNIISANITGKIINDDYTKIKKLVPVQSYDIAIINPPFYKLGTGKTNPNKIDLIARHEVKGSLFSALSAAKFALKNKGKVFLIYPVSRISTLFDNLSNTGFAPKTIIPVYSGKQGNCNFFLITGTKNGGEECKILNPIYIYDNPKKKVYSEQIKNIFEKLEIIY